ncbi:MAG: hypothetical protein ACOZF0_18025 [Thermodesulfobacteriota bacterium]
MANQYLLEIHRHISETLEQIKSRRADISQQDDVLEVAFQEGQLQELMEFKAYLAEHYNLATQSYP